MRRTSTAALLLAVLAAMGMPACGSASEPQRSATVARPGGLGLKKVGEFDQPVYVTGAPGSPGLLFVVEQAGRVVALKDGRRLRRPFLDLRDAVGFDGGERGLLSVAFPRDYPRSGRLYVYYNDNAGNIRIDEFRRRTSVRAAPASQRRVIEIPHPVNANHNGGQLQFFDGLLYFGTGDGGSAGDPPNNAQNKETLLGKLLRIDPRPSGDAAYKVPASNPFVGRRGRDEIYSYGLRNPFRFSFDKVSAAQPRIAIGDVGQARFEELDYTTLAAAAGANFGWDAFEGFAPYEDENSGTRDPGGTTKPIFAYSHDRGGSCSIIGGYVVRDRGLRSLYRRYLYADLCEGRLRSLSPRLGWAAGERRLSLTVPTPSSFGEDQARHVYVCSLEGPVYRVVEINAQN